MTALYNTSRSSVTMLQLPRLPTLLRLSCVPNLTLSRGRKSRNDPPAKSKASRIKYPPNVCPEELLNVRRRFQEYTSILTALRAEFKEEMLRARYEEKVGSSAEKRVQQEQEEHLALMAWNKAENDKALCRRLERMRVEEKAFVMQKEEASRLQEEAELEQLQTREKEVETLQELSKTFITPENLSERIEAALDNPKSYNFCLDREGRVLRQGAGSS